MSSSEWILNRWYLPLTFVLFFFRRRFWKRHLIFRCFWNAKGQPHARDHPSRSRHHAASNMPGYGTNGNPTTFFILAFHRIWGSPYDAGRSHRIMSSVCPSSICCIAASSRASAFLANLWDGSSYRSRWIRDERQKVLYQLVNTRSIKHRFDADWCLEAFHICALQRRHPFRVCRCTWLPRRTARCHRRPLWWIETESCPDNHRTAGRWPQYSPNGAWKQSRSRFSTSKNFSKTIMTGCQRCSVWYHARTETWSCRNTLNASASHPFGESVLNWSPLTYGYLAKAVCHLLSVTVDTVVRAAGATVDGFGCPLTSAVNFRVFHPSILLYTSNDHSLQICLSYIIF